MTPKPLAYLLVFLFIYLPCISQDSVSIIDKITGFPCKFFNKVNEQAALLESKLDKQTQKYLERLLNKERKLRRKLAKKDSAAAAVLNDAEQQYAQLSNKLRNKTNTPGGRRGQYIPYLDTLKTSLTFLDKNSNVLPQLKHIQQKISGSLNQVKNLQNSLQQTEQVKAFIRQRKEQLKQALGSFTKLPKNLSNSFNDFNKEIFYYSQQVKEYKEILNDPDKHFIRNFPGAAKHYPGSRF